MPPRVPLVNRERGTDILMRGDESGLGTQNVARISRDGRYLGTHSLHLSMPQVETLRQAVE